MAIRQLLRMETDDNLPMRKDDPLVSVMRQDLDPLSIDELDTRIAALHREIVRCEQKKRAAANHLSVADDLFKKG